MSADLIDNCVVDAYSNTPSFGDLTVRLVGADGQPLSGTNKATVAFKTGLHTDRGYDLVEIDEPLEVVIPSGAPLGFAALEMGIIFPTLARKGAVVQLCVVGRVPMVDQLAAVEAIGTGSYNHAVLYGPAAMSDADIRCVGSLLVQTGNHAGTWSNAPVDFAVGSWWRAMRTCRGADITSADMRLVLTAGALREGAAAGSFVAGGKTVTVQNGLVISIT